MELLNHFGWLILGLVLLYFGAEWLVKGAASLSLRIGLAPLVVGLTVVAFGTSAPELLVSLQSNLKTPPEGGFALGNVIGSNICNIALILGTAAVIRPIEVHNQVRNRELPILLIVTGVFVWMLRDRSIQTVEALILIATLLLYLFSSIRKGLRSNRQETIEELDQEDVTEAKNASAGKLAWYFLLVVIGLALLGIGADRLIKGGIGLAEAFQVPSALISLSLVALGTSVPELATSIVASLKKEGDIIVGNVIGSNLFNILAVIGVTGLVAPISSTEIKTQDIGVMFGLTILCVPLFLTGRRLGRLEGAGLLALYFGYLTFAFFQI